MFLAFLTIFLNASLKRVLTGQRKFAGWEIDMDIEALTTFLSSKSQELFLGNSDYTPNKCVLKNEHAEATSPVTLYGYLLTM